MDEDRRALINEEMMARSCSFCDAPVGEWCITKGGYRAHFLHADRWWAWRYAKDQEEQNDRDARTEHAQHR
jgi:hypothetical protein